MAHVEHASSSPAILVARPSQVLLDRRYSGLLAMAEATSIAAASTEHINGHANGGGRKPTVVIIAVDGSRTAGHAFDCE